MTYDAMSYEKAEPNVPKYKGGTKVQITGGLLYGSQGVITRSTLDMNGRVSYYVTVEGMELALYEEEVSPLPV